MAVLGTLTYAGLTLVGLPFALVFAVLTGMATVVPYYGALLSYIPPVAVALTISPGKALLVLMISLIAHFVEGNLVSPLIMARAVRLHPALVAAGVLAVERIVGFAGLLVAVPVMVTFKVLVEEIWIRAIESGEDAGSGDAVEHSEGVDLVPTDAAPRRAPRLILPRRGRQGDAG
jgi:predicted PurR-regulated permease PerM